MSNLNHHYGNTGLDEIIDILNIVPMPISHESITNMSIKGLNKLIQKEGFTKEESYQIKETRRRSKMKEYARKRRQREEDEIKCLEQEKSRLAWELGLISTEVKQLKIIKNKYSDSDSDFF